MAMKTKVTFLGTSDSIPSIRRNHTSILVNYNDENILIDCGEGTQRQFRKAKLNPCKITRILITHWHGDHVLGLPGILQTLALSDYNKKLYIYGPKGTKKYVTEMMKVFKFVLSYNLEVKEVSGKFFENDDFYLQAEKMKHGTPVNAYNFVIKDKLRVNKEKLAKSGIKGPLVQKLKEGKTISFEGKKFKGKDYTYLEKGKKFSFVLDTIFNSAIVPFVKGSDFLVSECTFEKALKDTAKEHLHLTSEQVGKIAKKAKVKKLILTHLSGRYENNMDMILDEVKENFSESYLVNDLDSFIL